MYVYICSHIAHTPCGKGKQQPHDINWSLCKHICSSSHACVLWSHPQSHTHIFGTRRKGNLINYTQRIWLRAESFVWPHYAQTFWQLVLARQVWNGQVLLTLPTSHRHRQLWRALSHNVLHTRSSASSSATGCCYWHRAKLAWYLG